MKHRIGRNLLSMLVFFAGVGVAFYVGIYLMLYGGIVGAIDAASVGDTSSLVWNIIRALFSEMGVSLGVAIAALGLGLYEK